MLLRFFKIGIGPGRPFNLSDLPKETQIALKAGVREGLEELEVEYEKLTGSSGIYGSRNFLKNDYLKRTFGAKVGICGNSMEEAVYTGWPLDSDGQRLDGDEKYEIRFKKDNVPPVKLFWSITKYNFPRRLLAANQIDRFSIGDRTPGANQPPMARSQSTSKTHHPKVRRRRAGSLPQPVHCLSWADSTDRKKP